MTLAAVLEGPRQIAVRPVALPPPRRDEVLIAVDACAICATDLGAWARGSRLPGPGLSGHEIAGVITQVGSGVSGLQVGDRVCVEPNLAVCCGRCPRCRDGLTFFCGDKRELPSWGFAEQMVIPARAAIRIPESMPTSLAVLAEPMACAMHAIRQSWTAGERDGRLDGLDVAIIGAGPLGLLALAAIRHAGARRVLVAARHGNQRDAARRLGAELIAEDLAALREARPQMVLIAAGAGPALLGDALAAIDVTGEVVVLGLLSEQQPVDARRAVLRGSRVSFSISYGGRGRDADFARGLEVLGANPSTFEFMLSHRYSLQDVAAAFHQAANRRGGSFRVIVAPPVGHEQPT
jgi:threonine dehydrogenase-like Zn-dependent dehydrogenase